MRTQDLESDLRQMGDLLHAFPSLTPSIMARIEASKRISAKHSQARRMAIPVLGAAASILVVFALSMRGVHAQLMEQLYDQETGVASISLFALVFLTCFLSGTLIFIPWSLKQLTNKWRYPLAWYLIMGVLICPTVWNRITLPQALPVVKSVDSTSPSGELSISAIRFCPPEKGNVFVELDVNNSASHPVTLSMEGYLYAGRIGSFYRPGSVLLNHVEDVAANWAGTIRYGTHSTLTMGYDSKLYLKVYEYPNSQRETLKRHDAAAFVSAELTIIPLNGFH